ncbi:hypothetical protein BFJ70_g16500 [Fusarium oxysporum]|uniref:Uncharacterized protein n=2 Tax=Fusarium oxysporum TaxID=5507 RepID=W9HIT8_FUSOX|nr:hypothetical protein FOYG_16796 [Fusarium oxysporum NRRL 32931]RKL10589.1 hypothetical protein BFJ70_g16500 [Fusarium oxysporum]
MMHEGAPDMLLDLDHECSAVRVVRYRRFVGFPAGTLVVVLVVIVDMPPRQQSGHVLVALW